MDLYGIFTYKFGEPNQQYLLSADWSNTILKNNEECHPSRQYFLTQISQIWHILDCLIVPDTIYAWTLWTSSMWLLKLHDRVPLVPQIPSELIPELGNYVPTSTPIWIHNMLITENSEVLWGICFVVFLIALYIICLEFLPPPSCLFFLDPPWTNAKPKKQDSWTMGWW